MKAFWAEAFTKREGLYTIDVLSGDTVTPKRVLAYYDSLKTDPTEVLVFYYGGHGGTDREKGHFLNMKGPMRDDSTEDLLRSSVRQAMQKKKPQCVVLLTDCCSSFAESNAMTTESLRAALMLGPRKNNATVDRRTVDCLFRRHTGVIDITAAAKGHYAWCEGKIGGCFSHTLLTLLREDINVLNRTVPHRRDDWIDWAQLLPQIQGGTACLSLSLEPGLKRQRIAGPKELREMNAGERKLYEEHKQWPSAFSLH